MLGVAVLSGPGTSEALAACTQPQAAVMENEDFAPPDMADGMAEFSDAADVADVGSGASAMAASPPKGREKPLPLVDMSASQVLAAPASSKDDVVAGWFQTCSNVSYFSQYFDVFGLSLIITHVTLMCSNVFQRKVAFDELFEKFCGAGGSNQFAYFDECWSKLARDKGKTSGALADAEGALAEVKEPKARWEQMGIGKWPSRWKKSCSSSDVFIYFSIYKLLGALMWIEFHRVILQHSESRATSASTTESARLTYNIQDSNQRSLRLSQVCFLHVFSLNDRLRPLCQLACEQATINHQFHLFTRHNIRSNQPSNWRNSAASPLVSNWISHIFPWVCFKIGYL